VAIPHLRKLLPGIKWLPKSLAVRSRFLGFISRLSIYIRSFLVIYRCPRIPPALTARLTVALILCLSISVGYQEVFSVPGSFRPKEDLPCYPPDIEQSLPFSSRKSLRPGLNEELVLPLRGQNVLNL